MTTLSTPSAVRRDEEAGTRPACSASQREVFPDDLPVSCPMPDEGLWNAHPRVYLAFDMRGRARCPYCSTEYVRATAVN